MRVLFGDLDTVLDMGRLTGPSTEWLLAAYWIARFAQEAANDRLGALDQERP